VIEADASRIEVVVTFEFLKVQAGVRGIALEEPIRTLGVALNVDG
jgi:hypothetical protein